MHRRGVRRSLIVFCALSLLWGVTACTAAEGQPEAQGSTAASATADADVTATTASSADASPRPVTSAPPSSAPPASSGPAAPPPAAGGQAPSGGKPGPGNTGVRPGIALTVVNGDQTFAAGGVVENKDFRGFVRVTGTGVTFRNCIFRGRATSNNSALLNAQNAHNTVVEDSEFAPSNPSATIDDIWIADGSIYRANIHGGVDGVKVFGDTLIQDSWIHDMTWFANDPNQGGGATHNDGVQSWADTTGLTLRHNTIDLSNTKNGNAALQDSTTGVTIDNNWLDGGGCTLNFDSIVNSNGKLTVLAITNNRFGRHQSYSGCAILLSCQSTLLTNSGNVWDDTGQAIPPPQRHDSPAKCS